MFKTQFTSVFLGLGEGRYSEKEGPGELYDIPKVAFSSHLVMEASKGCGKVVCTRLIHPTWDGSMDVSSNRTREMVVHLLRAWCWDGSWPGNSCQ